MKKKESIQKKAFGYKWTVKSDGKIIIRKKPKDLKGISKWNKKV